MHLYILQLVAEHYTGDHYNIHIAVDNMDYKIQHNPVVVFVGMVADNIATAGMPFDLS